MITVADLIAELSALPPTAIVRVFDNVMADQPASDITGCCLVTQDFIMADNDEEATEVLRDCNLELGHVVITFSA